MGISSVLTIGQIPGEITNLIAETKEFCFLITPYFRPWVILQRELEKAAKLEKKLIFVFRTNEVKNDQINNLTSLGFDIHFVDRLHTKLYINEKTAIISSMNLYDSSKEFNYEIGYKISNVMEVKKIKKEVIDNDIFGINSEIKIPGRFTNGLIKKLKEKAEGSKNENTIRRNSENDGHCIRCGETIRLNPNAPYCYECFQSYSYWNNPDFEEKHCHFCGSLSNTTMNKPVCYSCISKTM